MDYDIVATLGPASANHDVWSKMVAAGATAFRLNTSHLDLPQLSGWIERLEPFLASLSPHPPLILDLQGSKWRLGQIEPAELSAGQRVELVLGAVSEGAGVLPVPHPDFFKAAPASSPEIVLNDARVRLVVEGTGPERIQARVISGGPVAAHKGITFLSSTYRQEALSEKDGAILAQTRSLPGIRYAISYVKDATEMARYTRQCTPTGAVAQGGAGSRLGQTAYLIAKLERQPALDGAREIAGIADELWLCRGDLGAELGIRGMAEQSHRFSQAVRDFAVPVFLAGQVLEHMTASPAPTRSEIAYLYAALQSGYRGVVLSDETATGRYPIESCRMAALFKS